MATTATKERTTARPAAAVAAGVETGAALAERMAREQAELLAASEEALRALARGEATNYDPHTIFGALKWDRQRIEKELGRMREVLVQQRRAGSPTEYADAQTAAIAARQTREREAPELQRQISALQSKLADLDRTVADAAGKVAAMSAARVVLRSLVPIHAREAYDRAETQTRSEHREADRLRSRLTTVDAVLAMEFKPDPYHKLHRAVVLHCQTLAPTHPAYPRERLIQGGSTTQRSVDERAWLDYIGELRAEREELLPRVEAAEAARAAALTEAAKALDCYLA